jgi:ferrochelatase
MKKVLVLLNMGGPNNLDEVELFLKNMFNDKNIITVKNNLLRRFIAFMITASRKNEAKENYKKLGGKSPLVAYTQNLADKLQKSMDDVCIMYAMRYTPPFADDVIKEIKKKKIKELFLFPLYPQYSTTTTKSSLEDFHRALKEAEVFVGTDEIVRFYKNKKYNQAIIERIKESLQNDCAKEFDLVFSAHSLPQKIIDNGDSYQDEVIENVDILKEMLFNEGLNFNHIHLAYQSKLGPVKWLEPSLEQKLKELKNKKVIIYPISFILDNSETEFELDIEYRETAKELGFKDYRVAKCLNDSDIFVEAIKEIYSKNT